LREARLSTPPCGEWRGFGFWVLNNTKAAGEKRQKTTQTREVRRKNKNCRCEPKRGRQKKRYVQRGGANLKPGWPKKNPILNRKQKTYRRATSSTKKGIYY